MTSVELRYQLVPEYFLFAFLDAGRVWEEGFDRTDDSGILLQSGTHLHQLLPSIGGGVMAPTFLGSTAISGAWQLVKENELLHSPPRFSFHLTTSRPF